MFSIPFVGSLFQANIYFEDNEQQHYLAYDISNLARGEVKKLKRFSSEVWVYYRTPDDIRQIKAMQYEMLRDPLSNHSQQPPGMLPDFRSLNTDYFVFIPFESRKQCQVQLDQLPTGQNGFSEVCYRGYFDTAGRALASHGHQEQENLSVPSYQWQDGQDEKTLLLDRRP